MVNIHHVIPNRCDIFYAYGAHAQKKMHNLCIHNKKEKNKLSLPPKKHHFHAIYVTCMGTNIDTAIKGKELIFPFHLNYPYMEEWMALIASIPRIT